MHSKKGKGSLVNESDKFDKMYTCHTLQIINCFITIRVYDLYSVITYTTKKNNTPVVVLIVDALANTRLSDQASALKVLWHRFPNYQD